MPDLLYEKTGHVAGITLDRTDRLNAISVAMLDESTRALEDADRDRDARVIVATGAGRGFCGALGLEDSAECEGIESMERRRPTTFAVH